MPEMFSRLNAPRTVPQQTVGTFFSPAIQRKGKQDDPYIKKVTVDLSPKQNARLDWEGTAPTNAPGNDAFTVSTGKGYSDQGDPAGTCTRNCCKDALTQCDAPHNQPGSTGSCCTYIGTNFWTGTPLIEHNGWKYWTPIQPHYGGKSKRGIALHEHYEVTGEPIGHGCVRMAEENAHRIYLFSRGRKTNVTIQGRASPVKCESKFQCSHPSNSSTEKNGTETSLLHKNQNVVPGLEGAMT